MTRKQKKKHLVMGLIEDDLLNSKLVFGLTKLGLDASHYYQNISEIIFEQMGFDPEDLKSEPVFKEYLVLCEDAILISLEKDRAALDHLVIRIYKFLESQSS